MKKQSFTCSVVKSFGLAIALTLSASASAWETGWPTAMAEGALIPVAGLRGVPPLGPRFNGPAKPSQTAPRTRGTGTAGAGKPPTSPPQPSGRSGGPSGPRWTPPSI
jgi:hypothetical protein